MPIDIKGPEGDVANWKVHDTREPQFSPDEVVALTESRKNTSKDAKSKAKARNKSENRGPIVGLFNKDRKPIKEMDILREEAEEENRKRDLEIKQAREKIELEALSSVAKKLRELLVTYAKPSSSRAHARLAKDIKKFIIEKNKSELIMFIDYFGNERSNANSQMVDSYCYRDTQEIIKELKAEEDVPWEDLAKAVELAGY
jgi:hypothetical protein